MVLFRSVVVGFFFFFGQAGLACPDGSGISYVLLSEPPAKLPRDAVIFRVRMPSFKANSLIGNGPRVFKIKTLDNTTGKYSGKKMAVYLSINNSCEDIFPEPPPKYKRSHYDGYIVGFLEQGSSELLLLPVRYRGKFYRTLDEDNSVGISRDQF